MRERFTMRCCNCGTEQHLPQAAESLLTQRETLRKALEPFGDVDSEGHEDYGDDKEVMVIIGRATDYTIKLGDFRRARAALAAKP